MARLIHFGIIMQPVIPVKVVFLRSQLAGIRTYEVGEAADLHPHVAKRLTAHGDARKTDVAEHPAPDDFPDPFQDPGQEEPMAQSATTAPAENASLTPVVARPARPARPSRPEQK